MKVRYIKDKITGVVTYWGWEDNKLVVSGGMNMSPICLRSTAEEGIRSDIVARGYSDAASIDDMEWDAVLDKTFERFHERKKQTVKKKKKISERDAKIVKLYEEGSTLRDLADKFELSYQRVHQILQNIKGVEAFNEAIDLIINEDVPPEKVVENSVDTVDKSEE